MEQKVKLHDEIVAILKEKGQEMSLSQIAQKVNERGNYKKRDLSEVTPFQIHGRTRNYPKLFIRHGSKVGLLEWQYEPDGESLEVDKQELRELREKLFLVRAITEVLDDNGDELSTKVIASEINRRYPEKKHIDLPTSQGKIFLTAKNHSDKFYLEGDLVGLQEWNEKLNFDYESIEFPDELSESVREKVSIEQNSLRKIGVANFKSYSALQSIELKPITLLFGPNSSGKSSLIHSLLYLENAFTTKELDTNYMKISGNSVDLGGFRQLIHRRDYQRSLNYEIEFEVVKSDKLIKQRFQDVKSIKVKFEIRQALQQKKMRKIIRVEDEQIYYDEVPTEEFIPIGKPRIRKFEILTDDDPLMDIGLKQNLVFKIDYLNLENKFVKQVIEALILSNTTTSEIKGSDWSTIEEAMDSIVYQLHSDDIDFIPKQMRKTEDQKSQSSEVIKTISSDARARDLVDSLKLYLPFSLSEIIEIIYNELEKQLSTIVYLGPMRSYPPRHLAFTNNNDPNWVSGGANSWEKLRDNTKVREKVNDWLSSSEKLNTKYKLEVRRFLDPKSKEFEDQIHEAAKDIDFDLSELSDWGGEDGIVEKVLQKVNQEGAVDSLNDLVLVDQNTGTVVSHRDVGFGISQVVPVLVSAFANQGKTILIEQPEIHLHPALQAELGDVMIESALGEKKNTLILENHSELMMLRILKRIKESTENKDSSKPKISPEDVSLIFVQNTKDGTVLKKIRIDERGKFIDPIPGGFFEEDFEEMF